MKSQTPVGAVLMLVGSLAFVVAAAPTVSWLTSAALAPAVLIVALGTYLVGTAQGGRPV